MCLSAFDDDERRMVAGGTSESWTGSRSRRRRKALELGTWTCCWPAMMAALAFGDGCILDCDELQGSVGCKTLIVMLRLQYTTYSVP